MMEKLPIADPDREEIAERLFGEYKTMSPEEWAARFSHTVGCSSFDQFEYKNIELHKWIHRIHEILRNPSEIEGFRRKYLNEEELKEIHDDDPFGAL